MISLTLPDTVQTMGWSLVIHHYIAKVLTLVGEGGGGCWRCFRCFRIAAEVVRGRHRIKVGGGGADDLGKGVIYVGGHW